MTSQQDDPSPQPIFVSVKEMAAILGISRNYAYELLNKHLVESRYAGRRRLVVLASIRQFADSLPTLPPQ